MKKLFTYLILIFVLASTSTHADSKKIIKWIDKNGVTQYGDRPPLPSKVKKSSVLNKQGVTIQKIQPKATTSKQDKIIAKRSRYDSALLASYSSVDEIEIARKRNVRMDELALTALESKQRKINLRLQENNKLLLDYAKKNKTAPTDMVNTIEQDTATVKSLENQINKRRATIEKTNQRYEKDKLRYTELESKKGQLNDLKYSHKNITELKTWRDDAKRRLDFYEKENLRYVRRGTAVPTTVKDGLISTTKEVEKANKQIAESEQAIEANKAQLSQ